MFYQSSITEKKRALLFFPTLPIYHKANEEAQAVYYLTIRPVARKGYGSIAHEAKPNGLLIRGP